MLGEEMGDDGFHSHGGEAMPLVVGAAVVIHNLAGFGLGYLGGRLASADRTVNRTLSVEVGMQNSGLGAVLAVGHFSILAALPAALFSLWQNLAGALLAAWWRSKPPEPGTSPPDSGGGG